MTERAQLEQIVARGLNKGAVKRARVTLREMDERVARETAEAAAAEMIRAAATVESQIDPPMSTDTFLDPAPSGNGPTKTAKTSSTSSANTSPHKTNTPPPAPS